MCIRVSLQRSLEFIEKHGPLTDNTVWKCLTKEEEKNRDIWYSTEKVRELILIDWKGSNSVAVYLHSTIRLQTAGTVYS